MLSPPGTDVRVLPMDITQLKTLIHVAELGSLSKAADRLHIAQPALSRQIMLLEKELGIVLFERHGRGMVITDLGREILDRAARVMAELESIRSSASCGRSSYKGTVMVGVTPTVAEIVTVPLVRRIREAHPQLAVRFSSAFSGHLLDWLQRGELELTVSYNPQPLRSLRIVPIMMENLLLVTPGKDRLSLDRAVPFASLDDEELVLPSLRHGLRGILEECARTAGIQLHPNIEADSFGAMIDLVRNGFGSTVLPLASIYSLVQNGVLCAAPLVNPAPVRKLVLVYPADRPISPAARFVGDTFVHIATDLVTRNVWVGHMLIGLED
jgi:LysR family transcriptional regulator, nitrogen assimilation regulatory protein